jgi:hypothetical protein
LLKFSLYVLRHFSLIKSLNAFNLFFMSLCFWCLYIVVKEFDPNTCTWSIVRTYGKSPVIVFLQSTVLTFEHVYFYVLCSGGFLHWSVLDLKVFIVKLLIKKST